jgi:hypothetical protein
MSVYLDVNPSVELRIDRKERVTACVAVNDDAEGLIGDMELVGVKLNTALSALIGAMYVQGYLTQDSNSILVSVNENDEQALNDLTQRINSVFADSELQCSIIAQYVPRDERLKDLAKEHGVSVGKMHLIEKMIDRVEDFSEESRKELCDMPIRDLGLIYRNAPPAEQDKPDKEVISGDVGGYMTAEQATQAVLAYLGIEEDSLFWSVTYASFDKKDGSLVMIYAVKLIVLGEIELREYQVDCVTGEVTEQADSGEPEHPEHGHGEPNGHPDFLPKIAQGTEFSAVQ